VRPQGPSIVFRVLITVLLVRLGFLDRVVFFPSFVAIFDSLLLPFFDINLSTYLDLSLLRLTIITSY